MSCYSVESPISGRPALQWSRLTVEKRHKEYALFDVAGSLRPGRLTALVGPSGSGKTVLLQSLAGRLEVSKSASISMFEDGCVTDLKSSASRRNHVGLVSWNDELLASVTPREALEFSLTLRPPRNASKVASLDLIDFYLSLLDLENSAHTPFSNLQNLNEKRFATIASEMVNERSVLLLDAPLTGLSQLGGYQFIRNLKKLVGSSNILSGILCSLLQPTSEVLALFDDIILMADKGQVIYQGAVGEMAKYFSKFGHECPPHYNVSDFALFVLHSITAIERDRIAAELRRTSTLYRSEASEAHMGINSSLHCCKPKRRSGDVKKFQRQPYLVQMKYLAVREYHDILRSWKSKILPRFVTSIIVSIVIGLVYFQIGDKVTVNSSSYYLMAYRGCIMVMCCNAMFANAQATVLALPVQKDVFQREHSLGMYSSIAYLSSKVPVEYTLSLFQVLVQLIISYFFCGLGGNFAVYLVVLLAVSICTDSIALSISCLTTSTIAAIQMLPLAIFPQIIFSGLIISIASMPSWVSWIQYMCFLPYALKILTINEFGCASIAQFTSNDIECSFIVINALMLVVIAAIFRFIALIALQFKPRSYK